MIQFSLFGISVRVEPIFWLTVAFIGGGFGALQEGSSQAFLKVALFMIAAFISVLIHEMGHALTIKKFRLPTEVVLTAFGGYATYPAGILDRKKSFMVSAAGPALQFAFGLLVFGLSKFVFLDQESLLNSFIFDLILVSIAWAILNCLPIFPMDGGQMLSSILGPKRRRGIHITGIVTAVLIGLIALSAGQMLMVIFMGLFAWQNYQMLQQSR